MFVAREIMTTDVTTTTPDSTIEEVVDTFESCGISGIPVVDAERHVIGIITEYDLLRAVSTRKMRGVVADFMKTDIVTVEQDASLVDLAELLLEKRIRRVPVTRNGRLVGIISRRDLIFAGHVRQELTDLPLDSSFVGHS